MLKRLAPITRISLGLVSLIVCLFLATDLLFNLLPNDAERARQVRRAVSESLAVQLTALVQNNDRVTMNKTLQAVISRNSEATSIAVRRADGAIVAQAGDHQRYWVAPADDRSTLTSVVVPIQAAAQRWGSIEISYRPITPTSLSAWLMNPRVVFLAIVSAAGFGLIYLYMRRVLQHLDPRSAIPERVRAAFDTLTEAVLIIDTHTRIVLANAAFRGLHPDATQPLNGRRLDELAWLTPNLPADCAQHPWARAMRLQAPVTGEALSIPLGQGQSRKLILNCSPVLDVHKSVRGCLVSFDDVSALEQRNAQLQQALAELNESRAQIEKQNTELRLLASHDPLTGCLNRRAFFDSAEKLYAQAAAAATEFCCVMIDIDHFKSINDWHGHGVGDQVIQHVGKLIHASLRTSDLLCRYGGEEFCVALPGTEIEQAAQVAERIRHKIEAECGPGIRNVSGMKVTCSLGVAALSYGSASLPMLIDWADQALYAAKQGGRNQVRRFDQLGAGTYSFDAADQVL